MKRNRAGPRLAPALLAATVAISCGASRPTPVPLLPSGAIQGNFLAQQRLHFRSDEGAGAVDVVLQVYCGEVTVVALTPLGTRLFSIRQRGLRASVEPAADDRWPAPPERILRDVHLAFLYPVADPPLADGVHQLGRVQERWQTGRLRERTGGGVRVLYEAPERVLLRSDAEGYELEVETLSRRELTCPSEP